MSTEAQLLVLWAALVTAQRGCRRVDAHMSYSCQIPAGPASFPESVGKGVGKCGSTTQVSHRPQGGCLPPLQTSPAMSQGGPPSLPDPLRKPRYSNGVGEPLLQVHLSKEARPCSPAPTQEQGRVRPAALPEGGSGGHPWQGTPQGTGLAACRWPCCSPQVSLGPTELSVVVANSEQDNSHREALC